VPKPIAVAARAPKPLAAAPAAKPIVAAPVPKPVVAPKPVAAAGDPAKVKGKYTLQLSAFPTREEAEAFAKKYDGTFILPTDLPGRGTWFRVRCGNFSTYQDATAAKTAFEQKNKVIALVSLR
jgi:septal ring-binding cell division protein DamX